MTIVQVYLKDKEVYGLSFRNAFKVVASILNETNQFYVDVRLENDANIFEKGKAIGNRFFILRVLYAFVFCISFFAMCKRRRVLIE